MERVVPVARIDPGRPQGYNHPVLHELSVSQNIELIVVAGPMKGGRFPLAPDRPMKIGRASRGVNLSMDEHASLDHAEIVPKFDRYFIHDLKSHTGTFVNGKRVGAEPVEIVVGSVIEVGQSVLRMTVARQGPLALGLVLAVGLPVMFAALWLAILASRPILYEPAIVAAQVVRQRVRTSEVIPVPIEFVRDWGVDERDVTLRRVTDFDGNGVDELWLRLPTRELVITFGDRGEWEVLGDLPLDCVERTALDFPDQLCSGLVFTWRAGKYRPYGLEGVITWARPWEVLNPEEVAAGEPARNGPGRLQPYRLSLLYPDRLKGFLQARGVDEPIHYLLCEDAVSGLRAQVLTVGGRLRTLDYGCLGGVRVTGATGEVGLGGEKPTAFAFTVTGVHALVADLTTALSGSPEGLFLDDYGRATVAALAGPAESRAGLRINFLGEPEAGPIVAEEEVLQGMRLLSRGGLGASVPAREEAVNLRGPGQATLDPERCARLEVSTRSWHCKLQKWCLPSRTFLTVHETGCGEPRLLLEVPFRGGHYMVADEHVEVAVQVDAAVSRGQLDVLRTRIGYRVP